MAQPYMAGHRADGLDTVEPATLWEAEGQVVCGKFVAIGVAGFLLLTAAVPGGADAGPLLSTGGAAGQAVGGDFEGAGGPFLHGSPEPDPDEWDPALPLPPLTSFVSLSSTLASVEEGRRIFSAGQTAWGEPSGQEVQGRPGVIDRLLAAEVPEPATPALMLLALAGLRRRWHNRTKPSSGR